jgi:hypothetical protein
MEGQTSHKGKWQFNNKVENSGITTPKCCQEIPANWEYYAEHDYFSRMKTKCKPPKWYQGEIENLSRPVTSSEWLHIINDTKSLTIRANKPVQQCFKMQN